MIVVANTKELEEKFDLDDIPDEEEIAVLGGLKGKRKYNNNQKYIERITYTGKEIKQIIAEMKSIEDNIPEDWNNYQRAKYIYEYLATEIRGNYNEDDYDDQQYSSLKVLITKSAICAGYSLLFKEMMDRQGIECDYVRGNQINGRYRHAWNIITIDNKSFRVNITADALNLQNGEKLRWFGTNENWEEKYKIDPDEKDYKYTTLSYDFVNSIQTNNSEKALEQKQEESSEIETLQEELRIMIDKALKGEKLSRPKDKEEREM